MTTEETVRRLAELQAVVLRSIDAVEKRRSLRPSEKAMTVSSYRQDIVALQTAINHIKGRD